MLPMGAGPACPSQTARPAIPCRHVCCPLCGADEAVPILLGRDRWHGLEGLFRVVRCLRCGGRYQDPQPIPEALHLCYPADYQAYRPSGRGRQRAENARLDRQVRRRIAEAVLCRCRGYPGHAPWWAWLAWPLTGLSRHNDRLIPYRAPGRLLDVGCGSGGYLDRMRSLGWQVTGLEPDEKAARTAREALGLNVLTGELSCVDLPAGGFDAVTFWHVLEHLPEPRAALERARRLLRPGGLLVAQVPNAEGCCARIFGPDWMGLDLPRHLTHFSPRTLRRLLGQVGFRVLGVRQERLADGWKWSVRWRWPRARWLQRRKRLWRFVADLTALLGMADCVTALAERPGRPPREASP